MQLSAITGNLNGNKEETMHWKIFRTLISVNSTL